MRYVGCKQRLLSFIHEAIKEYNITGNVFCDLFSGTGTVGQYFKTQGYKIISNDLLYASYIMQQAKIGINKMPRFEKVANALDLDRPYQECYVESIVDYLNQQKGIEGFIYEHFSLGGTQYKAIQRLYYSDENAKKIDDIRSSLSMWRLLGLLNKDEFSILLYALLNQASRCANTTGTMSSFLKSYSRPALREIKLQVPDITESDQLHTVFHEDGAALINKLETVDILYLDPPYTATQYAASYHLLETIARWDYPAVQGISGRRNDTAAFRSALSSKRNALEALAVIVASGRYRHLIMSYSSDGIIPHEALMELFQRYGTVSVKRQLMRRYNTMALDDSRLNSNKVVEERLYYLKPHSVTTAYV
ncbi:MAG: DNA adenine methylase [Gammaproteobacteria bacterium]|nr:DNA adenine methylase [Gammaproteobacteria bacterium]MBY0544813.1 DNA adenine methylase [Gammaproteobacteria bacterium]